MDPTRSHPEASYDDRHREVGFIVLRSQLAVHAPQHGMRKDLLAPQAAPSLSVFAIRRGGLPALV